MQTGPLIHLKEVLMNITGISDIPMVTNTILKKENTDKKEVYDNYSNVTEDLDKSYTGICGQPVQNTGLPNTIRIKRQTILHVPCL